MQKKYFIVISIGILTLITIGTLIFTKIYPDGFNSPTFLMNLKGINYEEIIYHTEINTEKNKGDLIFYTAKQQSAKRKLIGLALFEGNNIKQFIFAGARNISDHVTWDVQGTQCDVDCEPIDIMYGTVDPDIVKLQLVVNNRFFEPALIKTDFETIWYIQVRNIESIDSIEAFSKDGKIVYSYPPKRNGD